MAQSIFCCDATLKRGGSCKQRASVQIVTHLGTVLNYCDKHGTRRVNDPEHKYHSGVSAVFQIIE